MKIKHVLFLAVILFSSTLLTNTSQCITDSELYPNLVRSGVPFELIRNCGDVLALRDICRELVDHVNVLQNRISQIEEVLQTRGIELPNANTPLVEISTLWPRNKNQTIDGHRIVNGREIVRHPSSKTDKSIEENVDASKPQGNK